MLLAMSQGNEGSMCSVHGESPRIVLDRLTVYGAMTRDRLDSEVTNRLAAGAIDLVVHLQWVKGVRQVTSVHEVVGRIEGGQIVTNELWRPGRDGQALPAAPPTQALADKLEAHGFDVGRLASSEGWWRR